MQRSPSEHIDALQTQIIDLELKLHARDQVVRNQMEYIQRYHERMTAFNAELTRVHHERNTAEDFLRTLGFKKEDGKGWVCTTPRQRPSSSV
jgi:hypothetical protein